MFKYKVDENIELRSIEPHDAEELNALIEDSKSHIKRWSAWLKDDRTIENTHEFIKSNLKRFADGEGFGVGIFYQNKMVGQIEYNYIDLKNRKTEIGYWLGEPFQGNGFVTKSCRAMIDHAFNELKLNRVELRCAVENPKSCKIAERLGFKNEGIIRQCELLHGTFYDYVIYGLLAEEWNSDDQK